MRNIQVKINVNIGLNMDENDERRRLISHILQTGQQLTRLTHIVQSPDEWLSLDITIPQMKVLMHLYLAGETNMARLASRLGIKLPSATGLVDRLVERGLVQRVESTLDRRLVLVTITDQGRVLLDGLWEAGWMRFDRVLERSSLEELQIVARAMDILTEALHQTHEEMAGIA
jgi:DNA-binding MarR family transcriptional regulator